jgi:hypothetical protein
VLATLACSAMPAQAPAQTQLVIPAAMALPPEAKHDLDAGLAAAQAQRWTSAIASFEAARRKALAFPPLLLDLGLAEQGAGNQAAAMYWLRAYLIAAPDAPNAEDVRREIRKLRSQQENTIRNILDTAKTIAAQFPGAEDQNWANDKVDTQYALFYAKVRRDIDAAVRVYPKKSSYLWKTYGEYMASYGEFDEAVTAIRNLDTARERDDLRTSIADEFQDSGAEGRLHELLETFEDRYLVHDWKAKHAIQRGDIAEAERQIGLLPINIPDGAAGMRNLMRRDELFSQIVYHYLSDYRNQARQSLAHAAAIQIIDPGLITNALNAVAISYLHTGSTGAARAIAEEANKFSVSQSSFADVLNIILGRQDKYQIWAHTPQYYIAYIDYYVAVGRLDEARQMQAVALRELRPNLVENWKTNDIGARRFETDLRYRMNDLLSLSDIRPARNLLREIPPSRCEADILYQGTTERQSLALSDVAEWEIDHSDLTAAAQVITSMPENNNSGLLASQCVVFKAQRLVQLAEAYLTAGHPETARNMVPQISRLIWQGALSAPLIERLAKLQEALSNSEGAVATRRVAKYAPLANFVWHARFAATDPAAANLADQIATITAVGNNRSGSLQFREAAKSLVDKLVNLAARLMSNPILYEVFLKDARDAGYSGR